MDFENTSLILRDKPDNPWVGTCWKKWRLRVGKFSSGPPHLQEEIASCWRWKDAPETNDEDDENAPALTGKTWPRITSVNSSGIMDISRLRGSLGIYKSLKFSYCCLLGWGEKDIPILSFKPTEPRLHPFFFRGLGASCKELHGRRFQARIIILLPQPTRWLLMGHESWIWPPG